MCERPTHACASTYIGIGIYIYVHDIVYVSAIQRSCSEEACCLCQCRASSDIHVSVVVQCTWCVNNNMPTLTADMNGKARWKKTVNHSWYISIDIHFKLPPLIKIFFACTDVDDQNFTDTN